MPKVKLMPDSSMAAHPASQTLVLAVLISSFALASDGPPPRLYAVTTETGMPNLEANLRYTTTHERRCLSHQDLASAFPILAHASLKDCSLAKESRHGGTWSYVLVCSGGHGTTGGAQWQLEGSRLRGTLNVKLGGKNMTFYQRITATELGECIGPLEQPASPQ